MDEALWEAIQNSVTHHSARGGAVARVVIVVETVPPEGGKSFITMASDASHTLMKPWEVEGFLMRALIESAHKQLRTE